MIEPSDSQECKDYIKEAYEISERFDTPVLLRVTTRICHSKSLVSLEERKEATPRDYEKNTGKYAMLPATARSRHLDREAQLVRLEAYSNISLMNRTEWGDRKIGVISSGVSYQYAREAFGDGASYLKLGLTNPLPSQLIDTFAASVETLYIVEEGEPYIENYVKARGHACAGKDKLPICGELNTGIIQRGFIGGSGAQTYSIGISAPARPPVLCAGCPHRGYFLSLYKHRKSLVSVGDIGCYSLGVNPPFEGFDISICMGAGISAALGLSETFALKGDPRKVFGMVGDSTFFHSGITGLIDVVHNNGNVAVCILDNSITAMTGHQDNPGTSTSLTGETLKPIDLARIVRATGIGEERIRI
jgi:indolepyruvate ferredoxin oxidoreductase alpha subunit